MQSALQLEYMWLNRWLFPVFSNI